MHGDMQESDEDNDYFDRNDPRTFEDIEQENLQLKEQMIHQIINLEQFLSVAMFKYSQNPTLYTEETFDARDETTSMVSKKTRKFSSELKPPAKSRLELSHQITQAKVKGFVYGAERSENGDVVLGKYTRPSIAHSVADTRSTTIRQQPTIKFDNKVKL